MNLPEGPFVPGRLGFIVPSLFPSSSRRGGVLSRITVGSAVSGVSGSVGRFSLLVVHVGSGLFEEGIKCSGWFDAYGLSEFRAWEEPLSSIVCQGLGLNGFIS